MNKADKIFIENCKNILKYGVSTENEKVRPVYKDGTPAHTIFVTQVSETYDISKDEFPIISLRPIPTKSGIKEVLAIYQSQTNTREGFESHDIKWWEDWIGEDGTIGKAYAYNLESHRSYEMKKEIIKINPRIEVLQPIKKIKVNEIRKSIDGKTYKNNTGDEFIIIENNNSNDLTIQFLDTGYIKKTTSSIVSGGKIKDVYKRSNYGVGYIGNKDKIYNIKKEHVKILEKKWRGMLERCYDKKAPHYHLYGGKGIFVHNDWHSLENFLKDIRYIPQYHLAKEDDFNGWVIDKDYYGSNCYSKNTCVFLKTEESNLYKSGKGRPFFIIKPDGKKEIAISTTDTAKKYNLDSSLISKVLKKERTHTKKYMFEFIEDKNYIYRYELSRNQINELLYNLKNNPYSRRHIVSFWNWANIDKKNLVECAYETLWTVRGEYLDMTLVQR